uniref:Uncharacterized protein n=1 Tax=Manihot esculenta TaxID=3983 RepID=A0A2C9WP67_MANES
MLAVNLHSLEATVSSSPISILRLDTPATLFDEKGEQSLRKYQ